MPVQDPFAPQVTEPAVGTEPTEEQNPQEGKLQPAPKVPEDAREAAGAEAATDTEMLDLLREDSGPTENGFRIPDTDILSKEHSSRKDESSKLADDTALGLDAGELEALAGLGGSPEKEAAKENPAENKGAEFIAEKDSRLDDTLEIFHNKLNCEFGIEATENGRVVTMVYQRQGEGEELILTVPVGKDQKVSEVLLTDPRGLAALKEVIALDRAAPSADPEVQQQREIAILQKVDPDQLFEMKAELERQIAEETQVSKVYDRFLAKSTSEQIQAEIVAPLEAAVGKNADLNPDALSRVGLGELAKVVTSNLTQKVKNNDLNNHVEFLVNEYKGVQNNYNGLADALIQQHKQALQGMKVTPASLKEFENWKDTLEGDAKVEAESALKTLQAKEFGKKEILAFSEKAETDVTDEAVFEKAPRTAPLRFDRQAVEGKRPKEGQTVEEFREALASELVDLQRSLEKLDQTHETYEKRVEGMEDLHVLKSAVEKVEGAFEQADRHSASQERTGETLESEHQRLLGEGVSLEIPIALQGEAGKVFNEKQQEIANAQAQYIKFFQAKEQEQQK